MPRIAAPKGDLPSFPLASQYAGTTEVQTMRPSQVQAHRTNGHQPSSSSSSSHHQPQPQQYRQDPRLAIQPQRPHPGPARQDYRPQSRPLPDELARMNLAQRPPVMGISGARSSSRASNHSTMMAGQAFGITPESPRQPPYDPVLWNIFCQVDADGGGYITAKELSHALINGNYTSFNTDTIALMIKLFDEDRNNTISFQEFEKLWKYLLEWKTLFGRFDVDHSGTISFLEFSDALAAFGYRLSTQFVQFLFRYHDKERKKEMTFDLFVQSCVTLRMLTDVFKRFDTDQDGVITIGFEDFLTAMIKGR